ncbi:transcription elongation regulator 1-like protein isoform X2 [Latimeria chalumnae]|uniref:transcription elongation regulator 1-like protein isoform X2 n=1 Tax=Latimeria chalumnae TaxID=7897 RepID=UPI00313F0276
MLPITRFKGQPQTWQMNVEPPPWTWMVPAASGLLRIGGRLPPFLVSSPHPPPLLQDISSWQVPCDPFLPLMPEPAVHQFSVPNEQWRLTACPSFVGFLPSTGMDFVPAFPQVYTSLPPRLRKSWNEKRRPNFKLYLNNSFALDSAWVNTEESQMFQGHEKPFLMTNQVAFGVSRPATSRPFHTVVLTPQPVTGTCQVRLKRISNNQTFALATAAAAMVAVQSEASRGSSVASGQPCHGMTLPPVKIPFLCTIVPGVTGLDGQVTPVIPTQVTRVAALPTPSMTFMATDWVHQTSIDHTVFR